MATYTVHEPPNDDASASDPERFAFVRDGFYFWAFVLTPLWMLRRRLWLVLLAYIVLTVALNAGLFLLGAPPAIALAAGALVSFLIGFEAASLRRWTLRRRGWSNVGVVVADRLENAEQRFFDAWVRGGANDISPPARTVASAASAHGIRRPPPASDVIGLFPAPGAPR